MTVEDYKKEVIRMVPEMDFDFIESVYWFIMGKRSVEEGGASK